MAIPQHWPAHVQVRGRQFLSLWKYYLYSRTLGEAAVPYAERHAGSTATSDDITRGSAFISYWMASLYVLAEGWEALGLRDATIDPLLTKLHLQTLYRYRHTVFHFQRDLDEPRIGALEADPRVIGWVFELGNAFQEYFEPHRDGIQVSRIKPWLFASPA